MTSKINRSRGLYSMKYSNCKITYSNQKIHQKHFEIQEVLRLEQYKDHKASKNIITISSLIIT